MTYTEEPLLEATGLTKHYGTHPVLTDLDLTLPPGIHALLGPNGAGKTTLVNILSTLIPHSSGSVRVLGLDPTRQRRQLQRCIALTGQYAAVDDALTGTENMLMMGQLFGLGRREATRSADQLLERFDLTTARDKRVATYSGGMRRKLDIAASLLSRPALIFLDEPTTGLDTRSRQALWDEIRTLARTGTSVFLTTQYLEEADVLADTISVLHRGHIVAHGSAAALKQRIGGSTIELHNDAGILVDTIATSGTPADIADHLHAVASAHPDVTVSVGKPTLDEVFLELTSTSTDPTAPTPEKATR